MDELIDFFLLGYFDAISDAKNISEIKIFKIELNNEFKSKLYDIGYSNGYVECFTYLKNSLSK